MLTEAHGKAGTGEAHGAEIRADFFVASLGTLSSDTAPKMTRKFDLVVLCGSLEPDTPESDSSLVP